MALGAMGLIYLKSKSIVRCQRGVHFGAACRLKSTDESSQIPITIFFPLFSCKIFTQIFIVLTNQNKNYIHNWSLHGKNIILKEFSILSPKAKILYCRGEIFLFPFCFCSYRYADTVPLKLFCAEASFFS